MVTVVSPIGAPSCSLRISRLTISAVDSGLAIATAGRIAPGPPATPDDSRYIRYDDIIGMVVMLDSVTVTPSCLNEYRTPSDGTALFNAGITRTDPARMSAVALPVARRAAPRGGIE